ncbi:hypothetical protein CK228_31180 [Mesorhizobium sp. WSM4312]|uniref:glycosyltransferase family 2 protein n=1 Tax=Mesorhizobium sp. WSM4312 TaxID=2029411 RepID=UPI000BAF6651|nr:glycosyltransferase family 2 protein [Mesorhizobium sp. WSM4312]PBB64793.1 hypothetical protein CK228_31180 [Mesorhizobium sp. WSM4312]
MGKVVIVTPISVSFVVPVYSGQKYLRSLVAEIETLGAQWSASNAPFEVREICLVDDNAIDGSGELIDTLAAENPLVRAFHLSRNFGQHPATMAGIIRSTGDWIVTLDEDLQHPPSSVNDLFRKVAERGSDIVYANAESAVHQSLIRDLGSRGYKAFVERASGNPNIRMFNSFRLLRGEIARAAAAACGHDTYFDMALSWFTQRVDIVSMRLKDERFIQGKVSGYRFSKLVSHARRMIMSAGAKPLRLAGFFGVLFSVAALVGGAALVLVHFIFPSAVEAKGWTSLILAIVLFGGLTMMLIAVVLEFLSVLVLRAHGKPLFFLIDRSSDEAIKRYFSNPEKVAKAQVRLPTQRV